MMLVSSYTIYSATLNRHTVDIFNCLASANGCGQGEFVFKVYSKRTKQSGTWLLGMRKGPSSAFEFAETSVECAQL
jgi:hypothetical protein